jgi:hypothetical protein
VGLTAWSDVNASSGGASGSSLAPGSSFTTSSDFTYSSGASGSCASNCSLDLFRSSVLTD